MSNEKETLLVRFLRLLISLSSGAVILVATFLRDIFVVPVAGVLLQIAVAAFAICVLLSVWSFLLFAFRELLETGRTPPEGIEEFIHSFGGRWVFKGAYWSFVVGIVFLAMFVIVNLGG